MARPFLTIIGLGFTGTSVGLALRKEPGEFDIVGHDKSGSAEAEARRLNAVTRVEWNLHRAMDGASLVVLAVPLPAIEEVLTQIAEDLAPDALVLVLNSLMQPVTAMAEKALPTHARVVVGHAIARPGSGSTAHADVFADSTFCLAEVRQTEPAALQLASDFIERVGAKPHFMDAAEHDGIMALVDQLPLLMGASLLSLSLGSAGWRESRQLAGTRFAGATAVGENAAQAFRLLTDNRINLARRLAHLQIELARWQELLQAEEVPGETHPLLGALEEVVAERTQWEGQALANSFENVPGSSSSDAGGGMFRQMLFGNLGRRKGQSPGR